MSSDLKVTNYVHISGGGEGGGVKVTGFEEKLTWGGSNTREEDESIINIYW